MTSFRLLSVLGFSLYALSCSAAENEYIKRADKILNLIKSYYPAQQPFLFNENYPNDAKTEVTYLVTRDTSARKKVAYLWPTSGVYSGVNALDKNDEYLRIFQDNLDHVWKHARSDEGLFTKEWSKADEGNKRKWLLDQTAMVEMYASLAKWQQ